MKGMADNRHAAQLVDKTVAGMLIEARFAEKKRKGANEPAIGNPANSQLSGVPQ